MSQPTNLVPNGPLTVKKSSKSNKEDLSSAASVIAGFSGSSIKQATKQLSSKSKKRVSIKEPANVQNDSEKSSKKRKRSNESSDDESTVQSIGKQSAVQTISQAVKPEKFNRSEPSPLDSLFAMIGQTFKPAPLNQFLTQTISQSSKQPIWLFSYPANFDYNAFSKLELNISSKPHKSQNQSINQPINPSKVAEFELNGVQYEITEGDLIEVSDLITLVPKSKKGELTLGKPFARILHINQVINQSGNPSITQSLVDYPTIESMTFKPVIPPTPADKLKINFLPIGANLSETEQIAGARRGTNFKPVAYQSNEQTSEKKSKKESQRRKTEGQIEVKSEKKKKDKKSKH